MGVLQTEHRTRGVRPELERQIVQAEPGMAHSAGSGPEGRTCSECEHWAGNAVPKRRRVGHDTPAFRHCALASDPQPIEVLSRKWKRDA